MSADDAAGRDGAEDVGTLAEEAAKLLGALGGWARDQGGDLGDLGDLAGRAFDPDRHDARHDDPHAAHDTAAPECRWCPACRAARVARELSPEVREQLAVAATALLRAGSGVLAALGAEAAASRAGDEQPARRPVERIDLDPDPGPASQPAPHQQHHHDDDEDGAPDRGPGGAT